LTIGGLISTIRTIVTKSGSKMAFVGVEDKYGEAEIIVFPNLYEKIGTKIIRDAVIRVEGKVSGKDRDGNIGSDAKIIADDIQFITDQELRDYESTGKKMTEPKVTKKVQTKADSVKTK
jgi:DNA polymerase-3 subunit alpha